MKFISFFSFFLELINLSLLLVPNWDLKNSSIDLLPQEKQTNNITIYDYKYDKSESIRNFHAVLAKNISRNNSNIINVQNYFIMTINNEQTINETNWEDIESSYYIDGTGHFVCPKGNNFIHQYNNKELKEIIPNGFNLSNNDWELICYYQFRKNWMFQGFLNSKSKIPLYGKYLKNYNTNKNEWKYIDINEGIFDFLWTTEETGTNSQKFNMFALIRYRDKNLYLRNYEIQVHEDNDLGINNHDRILLDYYSIYMHAYFDHESNLFYWMVSNNTEEFRCGKSINPINIKETNVKIQINNHTVSPFLFLKKIQIKKLNMIRNSRFVIYEISDENNQIYKGIIDIELNIIIFNTNEVFRNFTPLTNHSIFALTDTKAYEICLIKDNGTCVERCPKSKKFVLNNIEGNHCDNNNNCSNFILMPNNICIDYCNNTIYSFIDKKCGLCIDIDSEKQYKIMNQKGCLKEKPNNTYIFNEKYKLLKNCSDYCINCVNSEICKKCEEGYELDNNDKCIKIEKCYDTCIKCSRFSEDEKNQYCRECKKGFYYVNGKGNCLKKCPDDFYINNTNCSKCHENCSICTDGPEDKNGTENENCDKCKTGYLLEDDGFKNCVKECPNGTYISDYKCKNNSEKEKEEKNKKESFLSYLYVIFIGFCLLIITIYIYKNICSYKKKDNELINQIHTELQDNNKLIDG